MKKFNDSEFLLGSDTAKTLYHSFAENAPIIDYHCHIDPKEIYEDKRYPNIAQLWLGVGGSNFGDHYKWRLMRSFGVEEKYITGTEPDELRFQKWAECLERAVGSPLYHWSHLELKKYFGFEGDLNSENAAEVYRICNEKLAQGGLSVREIIRMSGVKLICTTDDPADPLQWHRLLREDESFDVQVLPAMRPDKAKNIEKDTFIPYLAQLGAASGISIDSFAALKEALIRRMDYFADLGCRVSDHALEYVSCAPASEEEIEDIFARRLRGEAPSAQECEKYHCAFLLFLGREYSRRGWVMQLHYGAKRDVNSRMFYAHGADTGYDCIGSGAPMAQLADFLDLLERTGQLPKTILYSLNPTDNEAIDSIIGCFQNSDACSKLQHGAAWWFNDHIDGMTAQMKSLANLGNLAGFVGMLTDSRSFLSYTRHDYFRRLLCNMLGDWVERGLYPARMATLGSIVKDISYNNAVRYFGFDLKEI